MSKAIVIRHSNSAYPYDRLSKAGFANARGRRGDFAGYGQSVMASAKWRARQTAHALGYPNVPIDPRFNELEIDDVNEPTPHGYVLTAHDLYPALIVATADLMVSGLADAAARAEGEPILVVSHNLAISSLLKRLSGEVDSIQNLSGLSLDVNGRDVTLQDRL